MQVFTWGRFLFILCAEYQVSFILCAVFFGPAIYFMRGSICLCAVLWSCRNLLCARFLLSRKSLMRGFYRPISSHEYWAGVHITGPFGGPAICCARSLWGILKAHEVVCSRFFLAGFFLDRQLIAVLLGRYSCSSQQLWTKLTYEYDAQVIAVYLIHMRISYARPSKVRRQFTGPNCSKVFLEWMRTRARTLRTYARTNKFVRGFYSARKRSRAKRGVARAHARRACTGRRPVLRTWRKISSRSEDLPSLGWGEKLRFSPRPDTSYERVRERSSRRAIRADARSASARWLTSSLTICEADWKWGPFSDMERSSISLGQSPEGTLSYRIKAKPWFCCE